jgi:uncharacterized membrane protein
MKKYSMCILGFILIFIIDHLYAHPGHETVGHGWERVIRFIGNFHLIFLHFPIVFIVTTGIAEWLYFMKKDLRFDHAARFMILMAAISAIPTVICGLALGYSFSYNTTYPGTLANTFWLHQLFGILTAFLAIACSYFREYSHSLKIYYVFLIISIISVTITGYLGGMLTFGPNPLIPS